MTGRGGRDPKVAVGRSGEAVAERYLHELGYRLLDRRFRARNGEIDLVMEDRGTIVFVEVRTRRSARCGDPLESVGRAKQALLVRAARLYLFARRLYDRPCRFDVVAVRDDAEDGPPAIQHIVDAFRADRLA